MVEAARKYDRMVQADLDSRSNLAYDEAFDYMHKEMGKILLVHVDNNYKQKIRIACLLLLLLTATTIAYGTTNAPQDDPSEERAREVMRKHMHARKRS